MKSRFATAFTVLALVGGTGGAIAVGATGSHSSPQGGAASGEYKPGKGCGDKNHKHTGPPGKPGNHKCPTPKKKNGRKGASAHRRGASAHRRGHAKTKHSKVKGASQRRHDPRFTG